MDFRDTFEHAPVSLMVQDHSAIQERFRELRREGVVDLDAELLKRPYIVDECMGRIEVVEINTQTLNLYRVKTREQFLANLHRFFRDEMRLHFRSDILRMWKGEFDSEFDGVNYTFEGDKLFLRIARKALPGHESNWSRNLVSITDLTDRKLATDALHASRRMTQGLFEHSPVSLWVEDYSEIRRYLQALREKGVTNFQRHLVENPEIVAQTLRLIRVIDVNECTLRLFEAPDKQTLLANLDSIFRDEMRHHWERELLDMWDSRLAAAHEGVNYSLSGRAIDIQLTRVPFPGSEEAWDMVLIALHDISARKKAEGYMAYLGTHDPLTGLKNRAFFDETSKRLQSEKRYPISVVAVDLNGLKRANDTHGHAAGDSLLRRSGEILLKGIDENDVAARMGGDEFALLLPYKDERTARAVVASMKELIDVNNSFYPDSKVSFSVGIATAYEGNSVEAAYMQADARMYEDKRRHYESLGVTRS